MKTPPPDDDPMLSALLSEVFSGQTPPDLSDQILSRLDQRTLPTGHAGRRRSSSAQAQRPVQRRVFWPAAGTAAALLTLAASTAWLLVNLRPTDLTPPDQPPRIATAPRDPAAATPDAIARHPAAAPNEDGSRALPPDAVPAGQQPPSSAGDEGLARLPENQSTTMELDDVPFGDRAADVPQTAPQPLLVVTPRPPRHDAASIVRQIDNQLLSAWQSLGVQPTATADAAVVADRLEQVIGVRLTAEQANDVDAIRQALRSETAQRHTAALVAHQLLGPAAWARLKNDARDTVVAAFSSAVAGQRGVDDVIAGLLAPPDEADQAASQAWLAAIGGRSPATLAEQLGHAVLDLDVRCGRCHDHPVDGSVRQADYWALAAALRKSGDATAQRRDGESLFYELPDGRQRAAAPAVPLSWLGGNDPQQVQADRQQIADSLIDNPRLAEGIVNRLWQIAYGHPLVGVASDPDAPPRDEHLAQLRQRLAAQLRAHDFDLGEAMAWIAAAAPLRLESTQAFEPSERVLASDQALAAAHWQVHAFAAFDAKPATTESLSTLLAIAVRFQDGATLDADALRSTLAQPSATGNDRPERTRTTAKERREALLRSSFPSAHAATAATLPAAWLEDVTGFDEQVRHLYYAAGYSTPTDRQIQSATALRGGAGSDALALNQLWWAMQHSATP